VARPPWSCSFALPNQAKTTITRPSSLVYNDDGDGDSTGGSDGGGDDGSDDDDVEEAPHDQSGGRRAPEGPSATTSGITATSSRAMGPSMFHMALDRLDQL